MLDGQDGEMEPGKAYPARGQFTRNDMLKVAKFIGLLPQVAEILKWVFVAGAMAQKL